MVTPGEKVAPFRPRLVLAHSDSAGYTASAQRHLQLLGWDVHVTDSGAEACRLTRELDPAMVVLAVDLHDQSGWLTCSKLMRENPRRKVVLVATKIGGDDHAFAGFVGAAALVRQSDGLPALVDAMHSTALSAAG